MLNCHWICINENETATFVHGFIDYNMKVKYKLSTDYDQKNEIFLKTYEGKSISSQPIPFPIDRDTQDFHALFQYMF